MKPLSLPLSFAAAPADAHPAARPGGASLDVLRFLAAAFILLFHYGPSAPVNLRFVSPIFSQGWLATDFFLLLSGFVLSRAYGARLARGDVRPAHFFLKRFARLWPSHMVVLTAFVAFILLATAAGFAPHHTDRYGGLDLFAQAFLVHGWGMVHTPSWNIPTWTLSALLVCYALFSLYTPWMHNRSRLALCVTAAAVLFAGHGLATLSGHRLVDLPLDWGLARAIPLFILGHLVERMSAGLRLKTGIFWAVTLLSVTVMAGMAMLPRQAATDTLILMLLATLIAASGAVSFRESVVTNRLGRMSFALFLVHSLVGAVWFSVTPLMAQRFGLGTGAQWGMWMLGLAAALLTAFLFDALIDKPLSSRVSRLGFVRGGANNGSGTARSGSHPQ